VSVVLSGVFFGSR